MNKACVQSRRIDFSSMYSSYLLSVASESVGAILLRHPITVREWRGPKQLHVKSAADQPKEADFRQD